MCNQHLQHPHKPWEKYETWCWVTGSKNIDSSLHLRLHLGSRRRSFQCRCCSGHINYRGYIQRLHFPSNWVHLRPYDQSWHSTKLFELVNKSAWFWVRKGRSIFRFVSTYHRYYQVLLCDGVDAWHLKASDPDRRVWCRKVSSGEGLTWNIEREKGSINYFLEFFSSNQSQGCSVGYWEQANQKRKDAVRCPSSWKDLRLYWWCQHACFIVLWGPALHLASQTVSWFGRALWQNQTILQGGCWHHSFASLWTSWRREKPAIFPLPPTALTFDVSQSFLFDCLQNFQLSLSSQVQLFWTNCAHNSSGVW